LTFEAFMELALYGPGVGYYRRARERVGYGPGTDFFTASTSGPVFGELVAAAATRLLAPGDAREFTFVEIGAEPGGGVLAGASHPFKEARVLRLGATLEIAGACVVFSNELFDAQPFRRFVFRGGGWRELGVAEREGRLAEVELPSAPAPAALPAAAPEGYVFDAPLAATSLARQIAAQPWTGLFLACDYGKSWRELAEATPVGTARAYFRHTQSNDLLARPGEQDLTCHVCWDWLVDALAAEGFAAPVVEPQETFFVRHAGEFAEAAVVAEAGRFSRRKLALMQLLHPAHLGRKFQVLHARRE
jgi:SAM-dependent MidA family methyltransferase